MLVLSMRRQRIIWVLNAACPSRCAYCDIDSQRATRALSTADVERVCGEIIEAGFREVIFVGGEPLLSPTLPAALAALAGRCQVAVFTGGLPGPLDRPLAALGASVERVVLSIDSGQPALNDLIRGRRGISADLLRLGAALREQRPTIGLSVNTVVSRQNADTVADVWERVRPLGLDSWSLTLAGDNFRGSPRESLLSRDQVARFYLRTVPALATRLASERVELVVLPVPFVLLAARVPMARWGVEAPRWRDELAAEFERLAEGDYNRSFVEACGCPLVGLDLSIGVGGEVYPCSQAPVLKPEHIVGDLTRDSLATILASEPLRAFGAGVPHAPCTRCWAPSNLPREELHATLAPHAPRSLPVLAR